MKTPAPSPCFALWPSALLGALGVKKITVTQRPDPARNPE